MSTSRTAAGRSRLRTPRILASLLALYVAAELPAVLTGSCNVFEVMADAEKGGYKC
ncbi:hypothetical protein [Saccharothrix sp. NRRL B-16348]|uniref:hypothetical protein n=1 Tax=Saccharothrix sp. NRRL B-16348 TaxID=1415542 RepID=UPI000A4B1964|nr:hypothetical protein [Saccharothrix sp. NRRL B-16348]